MSRKRGPGRPRKPRNPSQHTISCRDSDWERLGVLATEAGLSKSQLFVRQACEVELVRDARGRQRLQPRLVLGEDEQEEIRDRVVEIAERLAKLANTADLEGFHNRVNFILTATMHDMVEAGRVPKMTAILMEILGDEKGRDVAAKFVARSRRRARPDKRKQAGSD